MISLRRFILAAVAVAGAVNAQCDKSVEIKSDSDVSALSSCNTIKGDVTIGEGLTTLSLPSVQTIEGDLTIKGAVGLTSVDCPMLRRIEGDFVMQGLTVLSSLSMPELIKVGTISWTTLPALSQLTFTKGVTEASSVLITDTNLGSLTGISLVTAKTFNINNNKYLNVVDVALGNVSEALSVEFNGKSLNCSFPRLVWATNITIREAGQVSFPKLTNVNNSIAFIQNNFESVSFPELEKVGQSFAFNSNTKLTNVTANDLESVGGTFQFANNTKFQKLDGFRSLKTVGGSVDLSGTFTNATLPELDDVRGGFNLQTTEEFSCAEFDKKKSSGVIKGDEYTCKGKLSEAKSSEGGASTSGGSGSGGSGEKKNAAAGRAGISTFALIAVVAATMIL